MLTINYKQRWLLLSPFIFILMGNSCRRCAPKEIPLPWTSFTVTNLDNSAKLVVVSSNDSIHKEAYGLRINFNAMDTIPNTSDTCFYTELSQSIKTIRIYCKYSFDQDHPAGSEVGALFRAAGSLQLENDFTYDQFVPIQDFGQVNQPNLNRQSLDLLLLKAPSSPGPQEFSVEVTGLNSSYQVYTSQIYLF